MSNFKETLDSQISSIKNIYSNNKKAINIIGSSVILLIGLAVFLFLYWIPKANAKATTNVASLWYFFEKDSMTPVINGIKANGKEKGFLGAPDVAKKYWYTAKGKEAAMLAGLAYKHAKKWDKAIEYLDKTNVRDRILGPSILAAKATCYAELNKYKKSGELYEKAADWGDNEFTNDYFLSAGKMYELANELDNAIRAYTKHRDHEKLTDPNSNAKADSYIARAKAKKGDFTK